MKQYREIDSQLPALLAERITQRCGVRHVAHPIPQPADEDHRLIGFEVARYEERVRAPLVRLVVAQLAGRGGLECREGHGLRGGCWVWVGGWMVRYC